VFADLETVGEIGGRRSKPIPAEKESAFFAISHEKKRT
jgi:hypothetical protein